MKFNGTSASFTEDSDTQLRANVPPGVTTGPISVTNSEGTSQSNSAFTVINPPEITSFTPPSGPEGEEVTISGTGFSGTTEVAFDGTVAANFTIVSDIEVKADVPGGATDGPISITNAAGTDSSTADFDVTAPPLVTAFNPTNGAEGTEITISGSNFTGSTAVDFNGTSATSFNIDSDTQISANVPDGATTGPISVTNADGTGSSSSDFVVNAPPVVSGFNPSSGLEGAEITISGSNFSGVTAVDFNGTSATFTVDSNSQIRADVPVGATSGPISVSNPFGTDQSASDFSVTPPPASITFNPTDDAYVKSSKPTSNYGSAGWLRLRETVQPSITAT